VVQPAFAGVGPPAVERAVREAGDHVHDAVAVDVPDRGGGEVLADRAPVRLERHFPAGGGGDLPQ